MQSRDYKPLTDELIELIENKACLRGQDLSGYDLSGKDLSNMILSEANLSEANLSGANLSGCGMQSANLTDADLTGADLTGVDLCFAILNGADLTDANLRDAKIRYAHGFNSVKAVSTLFSYDKNNLERPASWDVVHSGYYYLRQRNYENFQFAKSGIPRSGLFGLLVLKELVEGGLLIKDIIPLIIRLIPFDSYNNVYALDYQNETTEILGLINKCLAVDEYWSKQAEWKLNLSVPVGITDMLNTMADTAMGDDDKLARLKKIASRPAGQGFFDGKRSVKTDEFYRAVQDAVTYHRTTELDKFHYHHLSKYAHRDGCVMQ